MMVLDVTVIALIAISLVVYIGEPLLRRIADKSARQEVDDTAERLLLQKEMLYGAIRDLDFDFQTGKVDQQDYAELRQQLEREAVHILRQLDAIDPLVAFDNEVEQQVLALRQRRLAPAGGSGPETCAQCCTLLGHEENFCPSCGQPLRLT
jgi:hypothetical protein